MHELAFDFVILLLGGSLAGFLAGLFGIGGGLVFIPVLFFVFVGQGMSEAGAMSLAVGTSLATIIFSASSSSLAHLRLQNIDQSIIKAWIAPLLLGAVLAANFVDPEFGKLLLLIFVCLMLLVALNLYFDFARGLSKVLARSPLLQLFVVFLIGGFSVLAGIGGGTLSMPAMLALGINAHRAVGTAALLGLLISLPAVLVMLITSETPAAAPAYTFRMINLAAFVVLALCSVVFAPLGARFGKRLPEQKLKQFFAASLLLVALSMLWRGF